MYFHDALVPLVDGNIIVLPTTLNSRDVTPFDLACRNLFAGLATLFSCSRHVSSALKVC